MTKQSYLEVLYLSDVIDLGYSKCVAIQLDYRDDMDDWDFYRAFSGEMGRAPQHSESQLTSRQIDMIADVRPI